MDVKKFFLFYLTLSVTTIAGAAIAFTFSALVNVFAVANLLVSLVFVFYMVNSKLHYMQQSSRKRNTQWSLFI